MYFIMLPKIFSCKQLSIIYHRINFLSKKAWKSSDKTWKNEEKLGENMENAWNFKS